MSIPATVRQYYFSKVGSISDLVLREVPLAPPSSLEVLVRIHAVSLNYSDLMIALGKYPEFQHDIVPCSDMAGEVISVGQGVAEFKAGDRVSSIFFLGLVHGDMTAEIVGSALGSGVHGTLTEYRVFPASALVHIPEHLSYEEASTLPCAGVTAWNAFHGPVPLKGGDSVLVQGTGGVSIFALQFASALGASVIVTSSSDDKLKLASKLGGQHLVNYIEQPDWEKEVLKFTNNRGVDHVIEVGGIGTLMKSVDAVRFAGWIHNIGFLSASVSEICRFPKKLSDKGASYRSILVGPRTQFQEMNRFLFIKKIKPVIDRVFDFKDAQEAFAYLESQKHVGKIVVRVVNN